MSEIIVDLSAQIRCRLNSPIQQRFFEIVDYMKERVNQYLDLLELAYYCLVSGFEGEHHLRADGRQARGNRSAAHL